MIYYKRRGVSGGFVKFPADSCGDMLEDGSAQKQENVGQIKEHFKAKYGEVGCPFAGDDVTSLQKRRLFVFFKKVEEPIEGAPVWSVMEFAKVCLLDTEYVASELNIIFNVFGDILQGRALHGSFCDGLEKLGLVPKFICGESVSVENIAKNQSQDSVHDKFCSTDDQKSFQQIGGDDETFCDAVFSYPLMWRTVTFFFKKSEADKEKHIAANRENLHSSVCHDGVEDSDEIWQYKPNAASGEQKPYYYTNAKRARLALRAILPTWFLHLQVEMKSGFESFVHMHNKLVSVMRDGVSGMTGEKDAYASQLNAVSKSSLQNIDDFLQSNRLRKAFQETDVQLIRAVFCDGGHKLYGKWTASFFVNSYSYPSLRSRETLG
eukprot:TRINITY_DN39687_c0_g1_i1.p1 TRINITY_DN39687_c0_g1~~TRINITY_DN39687_c0_g1_i1.p1  ORF type:complete len:439 (-),score=36.26 TRINITY_DN39687_c0_g1_i1:293-1426(-)